MTNTAITPAQAAATAESRNAPTYAPSVGTAVPGSVVAVRIAAPTWAPTTAPTVRMTVLMPVAMPVSVGSTASVMSAAIAANAKPTPTLSPAIETTISHGSEWSAASPKVDTAISTMPSASGHFDPNRRPSRPAAGPAPSMRSEPGSR